MSDSIFIDEPQFHEMTDFIKGAQVRFTHSSTMTLAEWRFNPNTDLPEHSHPHEQITKVISGTLELYSEGKTYVLRAGSVAVIPPNIIHSGKAVTECHIIDAFYPVREDYR